MRFLVTAFLVACTASNPDYPPPDLPAALTECTENADCQAVELGCCDSCNGGTLAAFRADTPDDELDAYRETCGNRTVCTQIGCSIPTPVCASNVCTLR